MLCELRCHLDDLLPDFNESRDLHRLHGCVEPLMPVLLLRVVVPPRAVTGGEERVLLNVLAGGADDVDLSEQGLHQRGVGGGQAGGFGSKGAVGEGRGAGRGEGGGEEEGDGVKRVQEGGEDTCVGWGVGLVCEIGWG